MFTTLVKQSLIVAGPRQLPAIEQMRRDVDDIVGRLVPDISKLNRKIYDTPETAWQEHHAYDVICEFLEANLFNTTRHAYGLATALESRTVSGNGG
ncbi:uncharacterized protein TrAFT101_000005 [Trichoderma asperellum]|uniref:uncharacterized protein n=1 Tax=Trichoderma asperellum TaxID=101201 RepID=UPI003326AAF5|nr:hypothetical protein TrAFT101_000005 [Trichoderma asperellum]